MLITMRVSMRLASHRPAPWLPPGGVHARCNMRGLATGSGGRDNRGADGAAPASAAAPAAARKSPREEEDEACLFNAAWLASQDTMDAFPAKLGQDPEARRRAIDTHVARQVALLLGSTFGSLGKFKPGVPPPGLDYAIEVAPSVIIQRLSANPSESVERGLIVRGTAKPGDVIGFYPGTVFTAAEVRACGGFAAVLARCGPETSADYMCGRPGGVLIDGLGSGFEVDPSADPELHAAVALRDGPDEAPTPPPGTAAPVAAVQRSDAWPLPRGVGVAGQLNGWANGHFANHPPKGWSANVVKWPYDFPPQLPDRLLPLVPNTYALRRKQTAGGGDGGRAARPRLSKHTIVLVAAVELKDGDECFLDYGFEAAEEKGGRLLPPWLAPAALRGDLLVDPATRGTGEKEEVDGVRGLSHGGQATTKRAPNARDAARDALLTWRKGFEESHGGRAPTRHDIAADKVAAKLFAEFGRLNKLEWKEGDE